MLNDEVAEPFWLCHAGGAGRFGLTLDTGETNGDVTAAKRHPVVIIVLAKICREKNERTIGTNV